MNNRNEMKVLKRNKLLTIILIIFFFIIPVYIKADYQAVIKGSSVNFRKEASTSSSSLGTFSVNTSINVIDKTLVNDIGGGCKANWYKISYNDKIGYVCSSYVSFVDSSFNGINVLDYEARVSGNNVTVRSSATTSSKSLGTLSLGVNVNILEEISNSSTGCSSGKMYKIKYYGTETGYMCSEYVTKKTEITAYDEAYTQTLISLGFPTSYIPYLTYLHNKYPNWNFVAKNTNQYFNTSVDNEEGKNYMQTTNDNYRTSSKPAEGSSWFKVNSQVIAYYMDPRNWLTEGRIFMFEKQDYSSSLESTYLPMVKSIFGSGALSNDIYTIPMVNAGKTNNISPLLIAARIRLEVGENGSDSTNGTTFTFRGQQYSGYYNFFNIGAYEETIDGIKYNSVVRGLAYAAKLINRDGNVWNNIETSITEGSSFLANGYVNKGQGTLYYQKFNVSPDAYYSNYTHQYQTNIQAPAIEGNKIYNSYKSANLLNSNLIFEIPVYNNMPEYTSLPNSGDNTNTLSNLSVDNYALSPAFDEDVLAYELYIPSSINKIKINATSTSSLSTITGNGEIEINDNETIITITNTAQTGSQKKYTITIHKIDDNISLSSLIEKSSLLLNDIYVTKVKNNTTVSSFKEMLYKNGAKLVTITNSLNQIPNDKDLIGSGFNIKIETAVESKDLIISVNGDTTGDGDITIRDLLQIQKHIKQAKILTGASLLAADTSGDNNVNILDLLQVQRHIKKDKLL